MSDVRLDMTDEALDDLLRAEMAVLRDTAALPALRPPDLRARRPRFALLPVVDPAHPRRLAPAALALGLAVLVAVGGGTWYSVGRLHGRAPAPARSPRPSPPPSAAPTPLAELPSLLPSTVPAGVSVFYYTTVADQPAGTLRLEAVDWSGAHRGHIDLPGLDEPHEGTSPIVVLQSPDGERLLIEERVYTSDGRYLYTLPRRGGTVAWGDDSRTLCILTSQPVPGLQTVAWDLSIVNGDGTVRPYESQLGQLPSGDRFAVAACAVSRDVVVASWYRSGYPEFERVSRMSSNEQLFEQGLPHSGPVTGVSVTPDGRWAAESDSSGTVRIQDLTGGAVRTLSEHGTVELLSGDGTRLMLGLGEGTATPGLAVVNVPGDRFVTQMRPVIFDLHSKGTEPRGSSLAYLWAQSVSSEPQQWTLGLFRDSDRTVVTEQAAQGVWTLWFRLS